jgi:hypothetical protein
MNSKFGNQFGAGFNLNMAMETPEHFEEDLSMADSEHGDGKPKLHHQLQLTPTEIPTDTTSIEM